MHTEAISHAPRLHIPRHPPAAAEAEDFCDPMERFASGAEHDAALLLAALDELESRRAALQWLAERDLLRLCLA